MHRHRPLCSFTVMKAATIAIVLAGLVASVAVAPSNSAAQGPPTALSPASVAGAGLVVVDLETERGWYEAALGMTVLATSRNSDGSPRDYLMGWADRPGAAFVDLAKWAPGQPRPNRTGRMLLNVPDAAGLATWLNTVGIAAYPMVPGVSYSVYDPEGNTVVLLGAARQGIAAPPPQPPVARPSPCGTGPTRSRLLDAALEMMAQGNRYESARAQDMYQQGLSQQSQFDEAYARCLRENPTR